MPSSDEFKLARLFGAPTLDEIRNLFALIEQSESHDEHSVRKSKNNGKKNGSENSNSVYLIETDEDIRPAFRKVEVNDKSDYESCILELSRDDPGLILMMRKVHDSSVSSCIRILPFAKLNEIAKKSTDNNKVHITLSSKEYIKLDISVKPSSSYEPLYSVTASDSSSINNISDETKLILKNHLEQSIARMIGHYELHTLTEKFTPAKEKTLEESLKTQKQIILTMIVAASLNDIFDTMTDRDGKTIPQAALTALDNWPI